MVDDNPAFAENVAEIMRDGGAEADVAGSGAEALELIRRTRYDALLTDMRMPEMGGAQLLHEMRQVDPGLPAIVVTAYTADDDLENACREGVLAVLSKPLSIPRLLDLIGSARRDGLVAVVEDDAALSDNLCEALRLQGFAALTATTVIETDRLGPVRPFAALVDLRIPGGPQGEAMRRFALHHPDVPIFVITAHAMPAPTLPFAALFTKPFDTGALLGALDRLHATTRSAL